MLYKWIIATKWKSFVIEVTASSIEEAVILGRKQVEQTIEDSKKGALEILKVEQTDPFVKKIMEERYESTLEGISQLEIEMKTCQRKGTKIDLSEVNPIEECIDPLYAYVK